MRSTSLLLLWLGAGVALVVGQAKSKPADSKDVALAVDFIYRAEGRRIQNPKAALRASGSVRVEDGLSSCYVDTRMHQVSQWSNLGMADLSNRTVIERARALQICSDWLKKMKLPNDGVPEVKPSSHGTSVLYSKKVNGYVIEGRTEMTISGNGKVFNYSRIGMDYQANKPVIKITAARAEAITRAYVRKSQGKAPSSVKASMMQYSTGGRDSGLREAGKMRLVHNVNYKVGREEGMLQVDVETGKVYDYGFFK